MTTKTRDIATGEVTQRSPQLAPIPPEAARAQLPPLTARQFKLGLVRNGIPLATVEALIEDDEDLVEWNYATQFERLHPLVTGLAPVLGLTDAQVDGMWVVALGY